MTDITVLTIGARDADGNQPEPVEGGTLTGCAVAPRQTSDTGERATDGAIERLTVYCPDRGADVNPTDQLVIDGTVYDIDGFPQRWTSPYTGWEPGCVIDISRKVG